VITQVRGCGILCITTFALSRISLEATLQWAREGINYSSVSKRTRGIRAYKECWPTGLPSRWAARHYGTNLFQSNMLHLQDAASSSLHNVENILRDVTQFLPA